MKMTMTNESSSWIICLREATVYIVAQLTEFSEKNTTPLILSVNYAEMSGAWGVIGCKIDRITVLNCRCS